MRLFKKLAAIYSGSHEEDRMIQYITRWIRSSVPGTNVTIDQFGNMYIVKGDSETYPCVVAHLDQVQKEYPEDYKAVETSDIIFGYSPSLRQCCGLGADDKCGIWIALKMLKAHDAIKVAFFVGEEVGCYGSSNADMDFFKDVRFVIEPDRRGANDLITAIGSSLCSDDFLAAIKHDDFGYVPTDGLMTDVDILRENGLEISCINLSCGYYEPHTENEYVIKKDMLNALAFVNSIIENCTEVYPHAYEAIAQHYYGRCGYGYGGSFKYAKKGSKKEDKKRQEEKEYNDLREYIFNELDTVPGLSVDELYDIYSDSYPSLTKEHYESIVDEYREYAVMMCQDEDEYWECVCQHYGVNKK